MRKSGSKNEKRRSRKRRSARRAMPPEGQEVKQEETSRKEGREMYIAPSSRPRGNQLCQN